jgi:hypothetical protein
VDVPQNAEGWKLQFSLWCLNPACIFQDIGKEARSVIVTSGTLSPMLSFQSELGLPFAHHLEAPHVVPKRQVSGLLTSFNNRILCGLSPQTCNWLLAAPRAKQASTIASLKDDLPNSWTTWG